MTDSPDDVQASEDAISSLAQRRVCDVSDPVVAAMRAWVGSIDSRVIAPIAVPLAEALRRERARRRRRLARHVAGMTIALSLSSTGLAAAGSGDPWTPLRYVTREFSELGQPDSGPLDGWTVRDGLLDEVRGGAQGPSRSLGRSPLDKHGPHRRGWEAADSGRRAGGLDATPRHRAEHR